jgi:hypothetical protein
VEVALSDDFVNDAEMLDRLNLPKKAGLSAIRLLDRMDKSFPQKDPFFGGKRYWPAVRAWFRTRYGVKEGKPPAAVDGEENFS